MLSAQTPTPPSQAQDAPAKPDSTAVPAPAPATGQSEEVSSRDTPTTFKVRVNLVLVRAVVRDAQGKVVRWYATGTDIDDRKRAEDRMRNETVALREDILRTSMFEEVVGTSNALRKVLAQVVGLLAVLVVLGQLGADLVGGLAQSGVVGDLQRLVRRLGL